MNEETSEDWKWQAFEMLDTFTTSSLPIAPEAVELLTCCEGQENLALDGIKCMFSTLQFERGDKLTALEFGRIFGHWYILCCVITNSATFARIQDQQFHALTDSRDKIDGIISEHIPDAKKGPVTGIFHLLAELGDPRHREALKAAIPEFRAVCGEVIAMAHRKGGKECQDFMQGYSEALRAGTVLDDGQPVQRDRFKELLMFVWPFIKQTGLSAADLHEYMDQTLGHNLTGNRERVAKHLNRRNAGLRGKGRPKKGKG